MHLLQEGSVFLRFVKGDQKLRKEACLFRHFYLSRAIIYFHSYVKTCAKFCKGEKHE